MWSKCGRKLFRIFNVLQGNESINSVRVLSFNRSWIVLALFINKIQYIITHCAAEIYIKDVSPQPWKNFAVQKFYISRKIVFNRLFSGIITKNSCWFKKKNWLTTCSLECSLFSSTIEYRPCGNTFEFSNRIPISTKMTVMVAMSTVFQKWIEFNLKDNTVG